MKFSVNETVFVPDGKGADEACGRTTALCFSAHQDDIEFMAYHEIANCFQKTDRWFSACVVTDGAGSPRAGLYADYTDEQMKTVRIKEQNKAATVGEYAAQIQLGYPSKAVKDPAENAVVQSIADVILACKPDVIYTHNFADKHDTHVAVALRVLAALSMLRGRFTPKKLYGMEVWRSLDWMNDSDKTVFDASAHPNLAAALMGVYDSQIMGGKRYDSAVLGRRAANATFFESHGTDEMELAVYAVDMSALLGGELTPAAFVEAEIEKFKRDVTGRIGRFT
ncbi:MAG TPA: PIG-L family deacetylase [Clostridiales bacterium]|nr:PIG-L family deacetylase [Clostridiales bacterium]